jgi:gephyrin
MISASDAFRIVCSIAREVALRQEPVSLNAAQGHVWPRISTPGIQSPPTAPLSKTVLPLDPLNGAGKYPVVYECHAGVDVDAFPTLTSARLLISVLGVHCPRVLMPWCRWRIPKMTSEVAEDGEGKHSVVEILKDAEIGEDVRQIGCDVQSGDLVMSRGEQIGAAEIALLATVGVTQVPVFRKPRSQ